MCPVSEPRGHLLAEGPQEDLQVPRLRVRQVQPHSGEAEGDGSPGECSLARQRNHEVCNVQVALKRQQAAEDALALNMRSVASGENIQQLPEGPIIGLPCGGVKHNESNAERRIKGETELRQPAD